MSRSLKIYEFIILKQRCIHTGNFLATGPSKLPESSKGPNPSHKHVHESLKALRSLVSGNSSGSAKVKKLLGTNTSWVTRPPKQYGLNPLRREKEKGELGPNKRVTLPSLLHPSEVSQRVKEFAKHGKIDVAINYVFNLPLDALNVQVWNTLIWEANKVEKYTLAWSLFNDMKKRGFEPSTYSYKTMLNGLMRIDDFKTQALALERAHNLYASFIKYTKALQAKQANHPELHSVPISFYLAILAKAGLRSRMWDTFYAMDKEGPMAPNASTFTYMLKYLHVRPTEEELTGSEWNKKVASEAAVIWRLVLSGSQVKPGFGIDSYTLDAVLRCLWNGGPGEQQLAFEIVHEHLGLCGLNTWWEISRSDKRRSKKVPRNTLNQFSYQAILELCRKANKPEYAVAYTQQIMDMKTNDPIMDVHNMNMVLSLYFMMTSRPVGLTDLSPSRIPSQLAVSTLKWLLSQAATYYTITRSKAEKTHLWPETHTYNIALAICRECKDWESTCAVIQMMTGQTVVKVIPSVNGTSNSTTTSTHAKPSVPILSLLAGTRPTHQRRQYFRTTPESLFNMMRCACDYALQHNKPVTAHECLSTIAALGGAELLTEPFKASRVLQYDLERHPSPYKEVVKLDEAVQKEEVRKMYWVIRAAAVVPSLFSLATKSGGWNREEYKKAVDFRGAATNILKVHKEDIKKKEAKSWSRKKTEEDVY